MANAESEQDNDELHECIDQCLACHRICLVTLADCLHQGGRHAESKELQLLMDCADICETNARFMLRNSDLYSRTCFACAEVCEACADACEQRSDEGLMKACAEACRRCEASCRRLSGGLMSRPLNPEAAQHAADLPG